MVSWVMDMSTWAKNHEHEHVPDFRKVKVKSYHSNAKQNNYTKLLGYLPARGAPGGTGEPRALKPSATSKFLHLLAFL